MKFPSFSRLMPGFSLLLFFLTDILGIAKIFTGDAGFTFNTNLLPVATGNNNTHLTINGKLAGTETITSMGIIQFRHMLTKSSFSPFYKSILVSLLLIFISLQLVAQTFSISGTVFEDKNYGGASGRNLATSSGVVRSGARVELFDAAGTYLSFATTNGSGVYTFTSIVAATYTIRVVNSSVTSSRTGYTASCLAVQTYRTNASTGTAVAVTDHVGGETPSLADAGNGSTTLAALTTASTAAQSISTVTISSSNITAVDFGYSFNVIVNKNNTGQGSLRQFITNANLLSNTGLAQSGLTTGIDNAIFMLADGTARPGLKAVYPTMFASSVASVTLASALPSITDPVSLDATLQPGYSGLPMIELNGTGAGVSASGLTIIAGSSKVSGFIINRFGADGINITTNGSNTITANYLGTNAAGTAASANTNAGIYVNTTNNIIGGTSSALRNIISGNTAWGIYLDSTSAGNSIQGNYLGTNAAGTAGISSTAGGVMIVDAASNTIGGTTAGAGNVISGNSVGVDITRGATGNTVQGNYMGTNAAGSGAVANTNFGVLIEIGASSNTIGGTAAGARNVISGNAHSGIVLYNTGTNNNIIVGNYIGTNASGTTALANAFHGVWIAGGSANNVVGGTTVAARNIISGNTRYGVYIENATTTGNIVQGNYIGRNAAGTSAIANVLGGVHILTSSDNNTIGGTSAGAGNLISGNGVQGVIIAANCTGNAILNNSIYGNTGIGIDLLAVAAANNGTKTGTLANSGMDSPVFIAGDITGTTLTLAGYVGSAAGQVTFANASVQVYKADNDASNYGEGQTYLGTITADANGNFNNTITVASGLLPGDRITGIATDATNNSSEFGINFIVAGTLLPLKMISFTVERKHGSSLLHWITANEEGVDYFEIQRSTDAVNYIPIGTRAAHNSILEQQYDFEDRFLLNGTAYYRLKSVDIDGKFTFSRIVTVTEWERQAVSFFVPSPVHNAVTVFNKTGRDGSFQYSLSNAVGQQVLKGHIAMSANGSAILPVQDQAPGIYFLELANEKILFSQKIMIRR